MVRSRFAMVLALIVVLSGACSRDEPQGERATRSPTPTGSATQSATSAPEPTGPRARPADREPTGAAAPPPAAPGRAPEHAPPAAGTYTYNQSGQTKLGAMTYEADPTGTLIVEAPRVDGDAQKQRHVRKISRNQEITSVYRFSPDAVLLTYISRSGVECAPEPALTAVDLPLKVGASWRSSGRCGDISIDVQGRVAAEETRTIGGERVGTYRVDLATEIRSTGFFQTTGAKVWLSPDHRLAVRSEEATRGSFNGAPFESELDAELRSLRPA